MRRLRFKRGDRVQVQARGQRPAFTGTFVREISMGFGAMMCAVRPDDKIVDLHDDGCVYCPCADLSMQETNLNELRRIIHELINEE